MSWTDIHKPGTVVEGVVECEGGYKRIVGTIIDKCGSPYIVKENESYPVVCVYKIKEVKEKK